MRDQPPAPLPADLLEALRAPAVVPDRDRRVEDIMRAVRASASGSQSARPALAWAWPPSLRRRRGVLSPVTGALVALALLILGGTESLTAVFASHAGLVGRAEILGDTVIARVAVSGDLAMAEPAMAELATAAPVRVAPAPAPTPLRDSVVATLYDTLRIVRLALRAPHATQVALAGAVDASASAPRVVARSRTPDGRWEVRAVVPRDVSVHSLALLVDGERVVPVRTAAWPYSRRSPSTATTTGDTAL